MNGKWVNGVQEGKTAITFQKPEETFTLSGTLKDNICTLSEKQPILHFHTMPDLRFESW